MSATYSSQKRVADELPRAESDFFVCNQVSQLSLSSWPVWAPSTYCWPSSRLWRGWWETLRELREVVNFGSPKPRVEVLCEPSFEDELWGGWGGALGKSRPEMWLVPTPVLDPTLSPIAFRLPVGSIRTYRSTKLHRRQLAQHARQTNMVIHTR